MTTTSSEKSDILNPNLGPLHEGNYLTNRCVYLEQLLNGNINEKDESPVVIYKLTIKCKVDFRFDNRQVSHLSDRKLNLDGGKMRTILE